MQSMEPKRRKKPVQGKKEKEKEKWTMFARSPPWCPFVQPIRAENEHVGGHGSFPFWKRLLDLEKNERDRHADRQTKREHEWKTDQNIPAAASASSISIPPIVRRSSTYYYCCFGQAESPTATTLFPLYPRD